MSQGLSAGEGGHEYRRSDRHRKRRERRQSTPDLLLGVLIALALAKALLSRALGLGTGNLLGLLLEVAGVVLVLCAADLITPKRSYSVDITVYAVLSAIMLGNVIYVSFFGEIVSPQLLSVVGQAGEVSDAIKEVLKPVYLLYLIDVPVLIAWAVASYRVRRNRPARKRLPVAVTAGVAAVLLAAQVVSVLMLPAGVDTQAAAITRGFSAYQVASIVRLALPDPSVSAAKSFEQAKNMTPGQAAQKEIDALRHGQSGGLVDGIKFGQYKGKNVIIIQVEALQDFVIGKKWAGQEITPNLNQLIADSWYFPNTYSETSAGNTVDAEFTVNTSLYSPLSGAASLQYADRQLPGLPRLLRAQGYDAVTMHVNDVRFWNRIELYPALGFRTYWDKSYYKNRDKMWHASDEAYFSMSMRNLKAEEASSQPFYSFMITESSHAPFKVIPIKRWPLQFDPAQEQTFSGRYIGSVSYTDKAIGEFIADLKQSGIWDDSIIMIYGDHSAVIDKGPNPGDQQITDQILGRPYSDVDHQRIPLIVHLPGQKSGHVVTKPVGQVDVMPTVAELVGLDISGVPHFGRSVFVDAPALIPTRAYEPGGTFIDDTAMFNPGLGFDDGKSVNVMTAQPLKPTTQQRTEYEACKQLDLLSDAWIKSLPKVAGATLGKNAIIP